MTLAACTMQAGLITQTATFTADNQFYQLSITSSTTQYYSISTDSYGGGTNLDGTATTAGGFVPVLTLFDVATGNAIANDGGDGTCTGTQHKDLTTGMCDDASITRTLGPGSYVLYLTEFPNVATGSLASNPLFLFQSSPSATGDFCGVPGGTFLQADIAPCGQRSGKFTANISSTPEPGTLWLALPVGGLLLLSRRWTLTRTFGKIIHQVTEEYENG